MLPQRPAARVGVVLAGFIAAFAMALLAVYIRQRLTDGPDAQASAGMQAGGEMVLGLGVFGLLALAPLALALCWLRPVPRFWTLLSGAAVLFALTGPLALVPGQAHHPDIGFGTILFMVRVGIMPVAALVLAVCGLFAPAPRPRWILIGTALAEGGMFVAIVLVKLLRP